MEILSKHGRLSIYLWYSTSNKIHRTSKINSTFQFIQFIQLKWRKYNMGKFPFWKNYSWEYKQVLLISVFWDKKLVLIILSIIVILHHSYNSKKNVLGKLISLKINLIFLNS